MKYFQQKYRLIIPIYIVLCGIMFSTESLSAQIGINTDSPVGLLHVDAQRNTVGTTNTTDDVEVDNTGNIIIGDATTPSAKLDIRGKIKVADGSQSDGYIFVSNASGVGTWKDNMLSYKTDMDNLV